MQRLFVFGCLLGVLGCARTGAVFAPTKPASPVSRPLAPAETVTHCSGTADLRGVLNRPAGPGPFPALVVVHGDYGLTDGVKQQAERLAGLGYATLAVDLYRGQAAGDLMDAHILSRGLPQDQVLADLRTAVDVLVARPDVRRDAVGILGWDMGGGYALDAAIQDSRLRAVVTCYGRLTTDPAVLAPLRASVLGIFAGRDEGISPQIIEQFRTAMRQAGKRVAGIHVYPACGNGFLNPPGSEPAEPAVAEATADAWAKIEAYLAAELRP